MRLFPASQLRFRVAAYGVALRDDAVLLARSAITNRWELPGGGVNPAETLAEGLTREFAEETGCRPEVGEALGFDEGFIAFFGRHPFHALRFYFRVSLSGEGVVRPQREEVDALSWWPLAALPTTEMDPVEVSMIRRACEGGERR